MHERGKPSNSFLFGLAIIMKQSNKQSPSELNGSKKNIVSTIFLTL